MKNLETALIRHCAPTLAGFKTGSMINISFSCHKQLKYAINHINSQLYSKGVTLKLLRLTKRRALIYVYRKSKLIIDLNQPRIRDFLETLGYNTNNHESCLCFLKQRIRKSHGFPHEIGLFLSYPVEDVEGFIKNRGEKCKLCGYWKVYSNEDEARNLFEKYKKCSRKYEECFRNGITLKKLTVAA
ncbi:DUF3793 family protein [Eubacteriaceae bacterium ES3]|nr:DUF3793 family protein [Eubacteriaceae bacterium ES3]